MSTRPNRSRAAATTRSHSPASRKSATSGSSRPGSCAAARSISGTSSAIWPTARTGWPSRANPSAIARPRPRSPPVTSATRSSIYPSFGQRFPSPPRKRGSRASGTPVALDSRFRGNDDSSALIRLFRQIEVREGAVNMRRHHRARRADIGFVELAIAGDAEQREADADLVFEDLEEPHHARPAGGGEPIDIKSADDDRVGPEGDRLDDIGAAGDRTVDHHPGSAADRLDDLRQYLDRADALVELAPAMVRHVDAIDPVLDRDPGILGGGDALDDQRDIEILLDPLDVAPVELRLVDPRVVDPHAAALVALGNVALAPAVAVGVDGQAEGGVALVDRAPDMIIDPGRIAAHVKLEDAEPVGRGLGGLAEPRLRDRREDHPVAEIPGRRRDGGAATGLEIL